MHTTVVLPKLAISPTNSPQHTRAPIAALLKRGIESPAVQTLDHGPLLEDARARKRLKVSKVAYTQPAVEPTTLTTANVRSTVANVFNDEEVGVIVREALAELRKAGIYGKVGQEAKLLKLVQMVVRSLSRDGTEALHRLLPLEDDWVEQRGLEVSTRPSKRCITSRAIHCSNLHIRNADETLPFGSCLKNMSLVTLFREHERLVTEVRTPESVTRRAVQAVSTEPISKAPVGKLNAYIAQKVSFLESKSASTLSALDVSDISPDVLAGRLLDKYRSSLGRGVLYLLRFPKGQLLSYTLDEHQAVVNALARRNDLIKMCKIVSNYIMKPMLDEKVNGMRPVKCFLARWDGHLEGLKRLAETPKPAKKMDGTEWGTMADREADKHAPTVRQDSAVHIQAE